MIATSPYNLRSRKQRTERKAPASASPLAVDIAQAMAVDGNEMPSPPSPLRPIDSGDEYMPSLTPTMRKISTPQAKGPPQTRKARRKSAPPKLKADLSLQSISSQDKDGLAALTFHAPLPSTPTNQTAFTVFTQDDASHEAAAPVKSRTRGRKPRASDPGPSTKGRTTHHLTSHQSDQTAEENKEVEVEDSFKGKEGTTNSGPGHQDIRPITLRSDHAIRVDRAADQATEAHAFPLALAPTAALVSHGAPEQAREVPKKKRVRFVGISRSTSAAFSSA